MSQTPSLNSEKPTEAGGASRANALWRVLTSPLRFVRWIAVHFLVILAIIFAVAIPLALLLAIADLLIALFDLVFRTQVQKRIHDWSDGLYRAYVLPLARWAWDLFTEWSDWIGFTDLLVYLGNLASYIMVEAARGVILFVLFLAIGFTTYHIRIVRRVTYAAVELLVALITMVVAIEGMAGGRFSLAHALALFSGLYIMVRGLQNMNDGLREQAAMEKQQGIASGPWQAWVDLWEAVFHGPYQVKGFADRRKQIWSAFQRTRQSASAVGETTHALGEVQEAEPKTEVNEGTGRV